MTSSEPSGSDAGRRQIDFFYSAHSAFAYIGFQRIQDICKTHNLRLKHRLIDLNAVVTASGAQDYDERSDIHKNYYFGREIVRWAEYRGVGVLGHTPTHHLKSHALANGVLMAGVKAGLDVGSLAFAFLQSHWRDDSDLSDPDTLRNLASAIGIDATPLVTQARSEEIKQMIEPNTTEAIAIGVLGSPSFVLDGDMFYGQDRLEMLERAIDKPFARTSFVT